MGFVHSSLAILLAAVSIASLGCQGEPQPLGWKLDFSDGALGDRATVVEAVIFAGDCNGEEVFSTEVLKSEASVAIAPHLPDGRWAFGGRARDSECNTFADGCTEVTLPIPGPVLVTLSARATESPACPVSQCSGGQCLGTMIDGGSPDACRADEADCTDGIDDDCNGQADCEDATCADDPACEPCASVTCGECEVCHEGACVTAGDQTPCDAGTCWSGSCCAGCWDGLSCAAGDANSQCGRDGGLCASCEGCGTCSEGACNATAGTEDDPCAAGAGICARGVCCTRCTVEGACVAGNTTAACGVGGGICQQCAECAACGGGACTVTDGLECPGGICQVGACCTGCWNGASCAAGDAALACGSAGTMCVRCDPCSECMGSICVPRAAGDVCTSPSGAQGTCRGAALVCCPGCWDGVSCQLGEADVACGTRGRACETCDGSTTTCDGQFCVPT